MAEGYSPMYVDDDEDSQIPVSNDSERELIDRVRNMSINTEDSGPGMFQRSNRSYQSGNQQRRPADQAEHSYASSSANQQLRRFNYGNYSYRESKKVNYGLGARARENSRMSAHGNYSMEPLQLPLMQPEQSYQGDNVLSNEEDNNTYFRRVKSERYGQRPPIYNNNEQLPWARYGRSQFAGEQMPVNQNSGTIPRTTGDTFYSLNRQLSYSYIDFSEEEYQSIESLEEDSMLSKLKRQSSKHKKYTPVMDEFKELVSPEQNKPSTVKSKTRKEKVSRRNTTGSDRKKGEKMRQYEETDPSENLRLTPKRTKSASKRYSPYKDYGKEGDARNISFEDSVQYAAAMSLISSPPYGYDNTVSVGSQPGTSGIQTDDDLVRRMQEVSVTDYSNPDPDEEGTTEDEEIEYFV